MYRPKFTFLQILLVCCLLFTISPSFGQNANDNDRTEAFDFIRKLGRGANLMAAKIEGRFHANEDFQLLKKHHFNHCRIGGKLNLHIGTAPEFIVDQSRIDDLKQAADWCIDNGLVVVLDPLHLYNDTYSDEDLPALKKIWSQVATAFAGYPVDKLAFEIMNEPHNGVDLKKIIDESLLEIRKIQGNERRIVIVSGQGFSTRQALINAFDNDIIPSDDNYIIGTYHYYDPKTFTKQGTFGNITYWGDEGNNDEDWNIVSDAFDQVVEANKNWAQRSNTTVVPIFLGEYGVDNQAPTADRKRWLSWIRMEAEKRGFATSLWNMYSFTSKGIGPWTKIEKNDPTARCFDTEVVEGLMTRYEMEKAVLSSGLQLNNSGSNISEDLSVDFSNASANTTLLLENIYAPKNDHYKVTIRYMNSTSNDVIFSIKAKNIQNEVISDLAHVTFPSTGNQWGKIVVDLNLIESEENKIELELLGTSVHFQLDYLSISLGEYHDASFPSQLKSGELSTSAKTMDSFSSDMIKVYPTIFTDYTTVSLNLKPREKVFYQVNDLLGKKVEEGVISVKNSSYQLGQDYQYGCYLLNIYSDDKTKTIKIIKSTKM